MEAIGALIVAGVTIYFVIKFFKNLGED